jgi:excisionase family DNA binding protein
MSITEGMSTKAYSIKLFSRLFNIGRSTVYREISDGKLRIKKVGSRTLIAHEDAIEWLNSLPSRSK